MAIKYAKMIKTLSGDVYDFSPEKNQFVIDLNNKADEIRSDLDQVQEQYVELNYDVQINVKETINDIKTSYNTLYNSMRVMRTNLDNKIGINTSDITTNAQDITVLYDNCNNLNTYISDNATKITNVSQDLNSYNLRIAENSTYISDIKVDLGKTYTYIIKNTEDIVTTNGNITTLQSTMEGADNALSTRISTLENASYLTSSSKPITDIKSDITSNTSSINNNKNDIDTINGNITTINSNMTSLSDSLITTNANVTNLGNVDVDLAKRIRTLEDASYLTSSSTTITDIEDDIDDNKDAIANHDNQIQDITRRLQTLEAIDHQVFLTETAALIVSLQERIGALEAIHNAATITRISLNNNRQTVNTTGSFTVNYTLYNGGDQFATTDTINGRTLANSIDCEYNTSLFTITKTNSSITINVVGTGFTQETIKILSVDNSAIYTNIIIDYVELTASNVKFFTTLANATNNVSENTTKQLQVNSFDGTSAYLKFYNTSNNDVTGSQNTNLLSVDYESALAADYSNYCSIEFQSLSSGNVVSMGIHMNEPFDGTYVFNLCKTDTNEVLTPFNITIHKPYDSLTLPIPYLRYSPSFISTFNTPFLAKNGTSDAPMYDIVNNKYNTNSFTNIGNFNMFNISSNMSSNLSISGITVSDSSNYIVTNFSVTGVSQYDAIITAKLKLNDSFDSIQCKSRFISGNVYGTLYSTGTIIDADSTRLQYGDIGMYSENGSGFYIFNKANADGTFTITIVTSMPSVQGVSYRLVNNAMGSWNNATYNSVKNYYTFNIDPNDYDEVCIDTDNTYKTMKFDVRVIIDGTYYSAFRFDTDITGNNLNPNAYYTLYIDANNGFTSFVYSAEYDDLVVSHTTYGVAYKLYQDMHGFTNGAELAQVVYDNGYNMYSEGNANSNITISDNNGTVTINIANTFVPTESIGISLNFARNVTRKSINLCLRVNNLDLLASVDARFRAQVFVLENEDTVEPEAANLDTVIMPNFNENLSTALDPIGNNIYHLSQANIEIYGDGNVSSDAVVFLKTTLGNGPTVSGTVRIALTQGDTGGLLYEHPTNSDIFDTHINQYVPASRIQISDILQNVIANNTNVSSDMTTIDRILFDITIGGVN